MARWHNSTGQDSVLWKSMDFVGLKQFIFQLEEIFEGKQIEFETEKFSTQVNFKRLKNETVDNLFGKPFNH